MWFLELQIISVNVILVREKREDLNIQKFGIKNGKEKLIKINKIAGI